MLYGAAHETSTAKATGLDDDEEPVEAEDVVKRSTATALGVDDDGETLDAEDDVNLTIVDVPSGIS